MNATPMNINPATAVQTQSTAGKQQDAAAPDMPFSQVLSREIAQNRKSSGSKQDSGTRAGPDIAPQAGPDIAPQAGADTAAKATLDETLTIDPLALTVTDAMATPGAPLALPATDAMATPEAPLAFPVSDAMATPETPVSDTSTTPEALLALPINPAPLQPAPARTDGVDAEQATDLAANRLSFQAARQDRIPLAAQAGQPADPAPGTVNPDPALPGKAPLQAAATAASASAFSGQLAAARQSDAIKTGEFLSDLMSNPAMRPASHAPLETLQAPNEIASPKLSPAVGTPAWGQAVGEKIVWMATAAQQTATLTLNPPNMGPLQIVLNVSNEQATASFFSAQPEVRQALEAAFPKLREMMNEAGIQLGQATVSADTPRQNDTPDRQAQRAAMPFPGTEESVTAGLQTVHAPVRQSGRGLIDTFA